MHPENTIFNKNLESYLKQLAGLSFDHIAPKLGAKPEKTSLKIKLFKSEYTVSAKGIAGASGQTPAYDICVILIKYLLLCPDQPPKPNGLASYRDFKDSTPLINFFTNDVERAIASYFSKRIDKFKKASNILGGYPSDLDVSYDFSVQFDALPVIPVILLYNDNVLRPDQYLF